jgi:hypothetical protein
MPNIGLSRKLTLFLILATLANGLFFLYIVYKNNGYLPKSVILIVIITTIFFCSVILIVERFFRKYNIKQEAKHNKDDEQ